VGERVEFDSGIGAGFEPQYFVLINTNDSAIDRRKIWVRSGQLYYGETIDVAQPFRDADFVLYSIASYREREDVTTLPFYGLRGQVMSAAMSPEEDSWKRAKAHMVALYQALVLSPDLIPSQADALCTQYQSRMMSCRERALKLGHLAASFGDNAFEERSDPRIDNKIRSAATMLDL
jgi:hypothetical protein